MLASGSRSVCRIEIYCVLYQNGKYVKMFVAGAVLTAPVDDIDQDLSRQSNSGIAKNSLVNLRIAMAYRCSLTLTFESPHMGTLLGDDAFP